jgi:hypothetical protein
LQLARKINDKLIIYDLDPISYKFFVEYIQDAEFVFSSCKIKEYFQISTNQCNINNYITNKN